MAELAGPAVFFVDFGSNLGCPPTNALSLGGDAALPEVGGGATPRLPDGLTAFWSPNLRAMSVGFSLVPGKHDS